MRARGGQLDGSQTISSRNPNLNYFSSIFLDVWLRLVYLVIGKQNEVLSVMDLLRKKMGLRR